MRLKVSYGASGGQHRHGQFGLLVWNGGTWNRLTGKKRKKGSPGASRGPGRSSARNAPELAGVLPRLVGEGLGRERANGMRQDMQDVVAEVVGVAQRGRKVERRGDAGGE